MCEEESDDHEAVAKLFEINDSIHRTIERYKLVKKGDLEAAAKIPAGTLGTSGAGVGRGNNNELSLIDLGGPDDLEPAATPAQSSTAPSQPRSTGNALEDDLLGLSIGGDTYGQGGALSLGGPSNGMASPPPASSQPHLSNAQITSMFGQPAQQPSPAPPSSAFGGLAAFSPPAQTSRPSSTIQNAVPSPKPDPFAALTHTPRGASPFQFQQSIQPPSQAAPASIDLLGGFAPQPASHPPSQQAPATVAAPVDDEWTFTSALPPSTTTNTLTITSTPILISWTISRASSPSAGSGQIDITSTVSNTTQSPVTELTFQVAVSKGFQLKMEPQSGRDLAPGQREGIKQAIRLLGVPVGEGGKVKMRWKVGYVLAGQRKEEMGEVGALGLD